MHYAGKAPREIDRYGDAPGGTIAVVAPGPSRAPRLSAASAELFRAVGERVRALRLERGLTLDELAARSGVSRRLITLLEAGQANSSLGTLDKLARALGIGFGALVLPKPPPLLVAEVPAQVAPIWEDGKGSSARLLLSQSRSGQVELWRWELARGCRYDAEADQPGSEETVVAISGRLWVEVGDGSFLLGPGAYLRLPTDQRYSYVNKGRGPAIFVAVMLGP